MYNSPRFTVYGVALRSAIPTFSDASDASSATRPSQLPPAELRKWTSDVVQDMFRGEGAEETRSAAQRWPNMIRPSHADDRYPLPLADSEVSTDMVYICRTPDVRGKFDAAKAAELKVFKADRGKLARGETVEVEDPEAPGGKRVVKPEDVISGAVPGSILIVINCKTENMPALLSSNAFLPFQSDSGTPELSVHCIVHRVSREVWENPTYQAWAQTFGPQTHHTYADERGTGETYFNSAAWNTFKLNMLDPEVFPALQHYDADYTPPSLPNNSTLLVPNTVIGMQPAKAPVVGERILKDQQFPLDPSVLDATRERVRAEWPEFATVIDAARARVEEEAAKRVDVKSVPGDDIVITTLGTGSAIPSKYRNGECDDG